jgi:hypothetical protein
LNRRARSTRSLPSTVAATTSVSATRSSMSPETPPRVSMSLAWTPWMN